MVKSNRLPTHKEHPSWVNLNDSILSLSSLGKSWQPHKTLQIHHFSNDRYLYRSSGFLPNIPPSFLDLGVHMVLQGWVLIEERLNCLDMLCIYYPIVNLVLFAVGLYLWGNECQMKIYPNLFLFLFSYGSL